MSDKSLIRSLNALLVPDQRKSLRTVEPRGVLAGKRVAVSYKAVAPGTGGGIASPLTEPSYAAREFHPDRYEISADGLYVRQVKPVKTVVMRDANDAEVRMIYAEPT